MTVCKSLYLVFTSTAYSLFFLCGAPFSWGPGQIPPFAPPPLLWAALVTADLKQALLQIRIKEKNCDVLPTFRNKIGREGGGGGGRSAHVLGSSLPSTNYCCICVWSQNDVFQILGLTFRHISQKLDRRISGITLMCVP